ncbi:MAG TPA: MFS transporter [Candidatus Krumholzibacteria bacterium]|nr:MFS transporter [Candidatus Krumholzibacteria bacterium]
MNRDIAILFVTRGARLFAYGFLSVILALHLDAIGFSGSQIGLLLTLTLIGDVVVSFWISTSADRIGRRRMLVAGALLMAVGGAAFASTTDAALLMIIATIGVFSASGKEVGPFLSIEQASLTQLVSATRRTHIIARYALTGSFASALGALAAGAITGVLQKGGMAPAQSYRVLLWAYAGFGVLVAVLFLRLSHGIEAPSAPARNRLGLHRSRGPVLRLSALFAMDSFAGGFIIQSLLALWFHLRFGFDVTALGTLFFVANLLAGLSALLAARIAARIGLINTMVFTHLPSNVMLMLVPLMPTAGTAVALLLVRFSISQMDVPTRQSYTMAIVDPDERSAAAGITGIARSVGAAISPALSGALMANAALLAAPFYVAGGLKIIYDLLVYRGFKANRPPEE